MNDTVVLVGLGVAIAAFVWFFIIRDNSEKTDVTVSDPKPEPVNRAPGGRASEPPIPQEAKEANKPTNLPDQKTLEKLTKSQIEELGRKHGIELDKRMTKAKMIADLKKQFEAL